MFRCTEGDRRRSVLGFATSAAIDYSWAKPLGLPLWSSSAEELYVATVSADKTQVARVFDASQRLVPTDRTVQAMLRYIHVQYVGIFLDPHNHTIKGFE